MRAYFSWLPLALLAVLTTGCKIKSTEQIPATPPLAIAQPQDVLKHLQYVGVHKDIPHLPMLGTMDVSTLYSNAQWFHNHAGEMNITLTDKEIADLQIVEAKTMGYIVPDVSKKLLDMEYTKVLAQVIPALPPHLAGFDMEKVDKLPEPKDTNPQRAQDAQALSTKHLRPLFYAGIYRLIKGMPVSLWPDLTVLSQQQSRENVNWQAVTIGLEGKPVLDLTLSKQSNGTYGLFYIYFKVSPKKLEQAAAQLHPDSVKK